MQRTGEVYGVAGWEQLRGDPALAYQNLHTDLRKILDNALNQLFDIRLSSPPVLNLTKRKSNSAPSISSLSVRIYPVLYLMMADHPYLRAKPAR